MLNRPLLAASYWIAARDRSQEEKDRGKVLSRFLSPLTSFSSLITEKRTSKQYNESGHNYRASQMGLMGSPSKPVPRQVEGQDAINRPPELLEA